METTIQSARQSQANIEAEDRFLQWKVKKRLAELRDAEATGDQEQVKNVARMISGTLDPRVVGGRTEFSKRAVITKSAPQFSALLTDLERVAGPDLRLAPVAISDAVSRLRALGSRFGTFHIWTKKPKWATCDRIVAALLNGDQDAEEYLDWFLRSELKGNGDLAPYVAAVLWSDDGRKWRAWDESSIYPRIIRRARKRRYWDERDAEWLTPLPNTISLSELTTQPQLVTHPLELVFSIEAPIKLDVLRQMSECLAFDGRLAGLNFTLDELQYFKLKKILCLTQVEVQVLSVI